MKLFLELTLAAWGERRLAVVLSIFSLALSTALLLGVLQLQKGIRRNFTGAVSGIDLIVGARGGRLELLLGSVFQIGRGTGVLSHKSFRRLREQPEVKFALPLVYGDSHRGFRVLGTSVEFFKKFRYGRNRKPVFAKGRTPAMAFEAVLGYEAARRLGYFMGDKIILSHGLERLALLRHTDRPFHLVGVLKRTFTPLDRLIFVPLEGLQAIHEPTGAKRKPMGVNAVFLGLKSRLDVLRMQRRINKDRDEALTAIHPIPELMRFLEFLSLVERAFLGTAIAVVLLALCTMMITVFASVERRRREIAILRALGASPFRILGLIWFESFLLFVLGVGAGFLMMYGILFLLRPLIELMSGIYIFLSPPGAKEAAFAFCIGLAALTAGLWPASGALRSTLADGLRMRE